MLSKVQIHQVGPLHLACIRSIGRHESVDPRLWRRITARLDDRGIGGDRMPVGIGHDAPSIAAPDQLRFDAAVSVAQPFEGDQLIAYQHFKRAIHAGVVHVGAPATLPDAYARLGEAMGQLQGYRMIGLPVLEIYRTTSVTMNDVLTRTRSYCRSSESSASAPHRKL